MAKYIKLASRSHFMEEVNRECKRHVFVCINEREPGKDCCGHVGGMEIFKKLKEYVITNGLVNQIWVTKASCLGFCNNVGTTIMIYPEKKIYKQVKMDEIDKIIDILKKDL